MSISRIVEMVGNPDDLILGREVVARAETLARRGIATAVVLPREHSLGTALRRRGVNVATSIRFDDDPPWAALRSTVAFVDEMRASVLYVHHTGGHVLGAEVSALTGLCCLASVEADELNMLELEAHHLHGGMHLSVSGEPALLQARSLGVSRERLHRIPNGVATLEASATRNLHSALNLADDVALIGWVGHLSSTDDPQKFVYIAQRVARARGDARFVMIGEGPLRDEIAALIAMQGLAGRFYRFESLDDAGDVSLASLSCAMFASRGGTPRAALQAMADGVPIMAIARSDLAQGVRDHALGLVVDNASAAGDAIVELLSDASLRSSLARAARHHAQRAYSIDATCDALLQAFDRMGARD